jgi:hypothetical protein
MAEGIHKGSLRRSLSCNAGYIHKFDAAWQSIDISVAIPGEQSQQAKMWSPEEIKEPY